MPTLWTALRSRWLDSGGGMDRPGDGLGEHLRRDIGLSNRGLTAGSPAAGERRFDPPHHIRDRNLSDARTFLTLQPYR